MKKSRILSLLIAVVFVLTSVSIPAFAATSFVYTEADTTFTSSSNKYKAPVEGLPLHYAITVADPDDASKEYTYSLDGSPSYNSTYASGFSIENNGLFSVKPEVTGLITNAGVTTIDPFVTPKATSKADSSDALLSTRNFTTIEAAVDLDFEDDVTTGLSNGIVETDATTDNKYYKLTSSDHIVLARANFINQHNSIVGRLAAPAIIEFSTDSLGNGFYYSNTCMVSNATTTIPAGWNDYKIVIEHVGVNSKTFAVYMNGKLINSGSYTQASSHGDPWLYASRVDNVKCYSTSLGFPFNVTLTAPATQVVGAEFTASASKYTMPTSNVPEALEYAIFVADTVDAAEEDWTQYNGNSLEITEDLDLKYIKAGARVKEHTLHDCATEWAYSDPAQIRILADPISWVTNPTVKSPIKNIDYWFLPPQMPGDVFELPFEITGGKSSDKITHAVELADYDASSVSIRYVNGNTKKAILSLSNPDMVTGRKSAPISVMYTDGTTTTKHYPFGTISEGDLKAYNFEDGIAPANATILEEANGNHYATGSATYSFWPNKADIDYVRSVYGTIAVDLDIYVGGDFSTLSPTIPNWAGGFYLAELDRNPGYVYDRAASGAPVYVGEGWKHVRIYLDLSGATYSLFVDGKAITINRNVGLVDPTAEPILQHIDAQGETDNYTYGSVTVKTPAVYNAAIKNAAVGKALAADYDFFCGAFYDNADISDIKYYISNEINGTYTECEDNFIPDEEDIGKYVYAEITPKVNYYLGEINTGSVVRTAPARIGDVSIGAITLSVDGEVANMADSAIRNGGASSEVKLTVNAASASGETVKFILAQYNPTWNNVVNIAVEGKTLTANESPYEITLSASGVNDFSYFKLFILTSEGLVPVNNVVNLR